MTEGIIPPVEPEIPVGKETTPVPLTLLAFGLGPVTDSVRREKANQTVAVPGQEDVNFFSKTEAYAASELLKRGVASDIVIMGGKTGGDEFKSEAELISEHMQAYGIDKDKIKQEDHSTNTLENLVNFLNLYLDNPNPKPDSDFSNRRFGLLAADYHLPRVKLLAELFELPYDVAFTNEAVVRYIAREEGDQQTLNELDQRLNMDEPNGEGYFDKQFGTEKQNTIRKRGLEENLFTRALLEVPEYWIMYIGRLTSEDRIRKILGKLDAKDLQKFDVDVSEDIDTIKQKLVAIPRVVPDPKVWAVPEIPEETMDKLMHIADQRNKKKAI